MFKAVLIAALLLGGKKPEQTGIVMGTVVAPSQQKISQPIQVILLSSRYTDIWNSDVQKRLDVYWETFKPAFAKQKDFFSTVSKQAHWEATEYVLTRMRRDASNDVSNYLKQTSADGRFEFKDIPFGEYKVLAVGRVGGQEIMWQEFIDVRDAIPQLIELKKRVP
jgi:hypothetical protein